MEPPRHLEVSPEDAGLRLDVLLARELRLSRGYVRRLLARGSVQVAGRAAVKGTVLRAGDTVEIEAFRHPDTGPVAAPELRVTRLAESASYLAIDKPAGVPSHPLDYDESRTALGAAAALCPEVLEVGGGRLEGGLVHRLDTDTSGVLVLARNDAAWERARRALTEQRAVKAYRARVHGSLDEAVDVRLRLEQRGEHVAVVASGGRPAVMRIEPIPATQGTVKGSDDPSTLVHIVPSTGMRHQIRVALAELGHPVVGDTLYGSPTKLGRHLLHSTHFALDDFEARSEPPPEFAAPLEEGH